MASIISSLAWVRQGIAAKIPDKYEMDDAEIERISQFAKLELEDAQQDLENAQRQSNLSNGHDDQGDGVNENEYDDDQDEEMIEEVVVNDKDGEDELAKYNLNDYDKEDSKSSSIFSKIKGLSYYESNEEDPYITLKDDDDPDDDNDIRIMPTDNLLVSAKTEEEISHLEVYVYESNQDNLYVHHDILLPSFPLCLEWMDFRLGRKANQDGTGNYLAVGTFDPDIEIWDLDTIDCMYPDAILGAPKQDIQDTSDGKLKKKKSNKKSKKINSEYHVDSVMGLSWNTNHRNVLASSSADTTVKIWDLSKLTCVRSFEHHKDKVQAVQWNPSEATVMLTGSYDKTVAAFDSRALETATTWTLSADVESLSWDPHSSTHFYVAMENGLIQYYDVRETSKAVFTLQAHDDAVSSFDINPVYKGLIATGSTDKIVKLWNVKDNAPSMITSRDLQVGRVFSLRFCPDAPFRLAAAGSQGEVNIWDIEPKAGRYFKNSNETEEKPLIGVNVDEDSGDSSADEGDKDDGI